MIMGFSRCAVIAIFAATVVASCENASQVVGTSPGAMPQAASTRSKSWHGLTPVSLASFFEGSTTAGTRGSLLSQGPPPRRCPSRCWIFGSEFGGTTINRYTPGSNDPPNCDRLRATSVNGFGAAFKALYVPDGDTDSIKIFDTRRNGRVCPEKPDDSVIDGTPSQPFGQPSDAAGTRFGMAVANIVTYSSTPPYYGPGSLTACTQSGFRGAWTCTNYTNSAITGYAGGVACCSYVGSTYYCYLSAEGGPPSSPVGVLISYPNCSGSGTQVGGFVNPSTGGLDIDRDGNLVAISISDATVYVYSGCPNCQLKFKSRRLAGLPIYGHLDKFSAQFIVGDAANGSLDVYRYRLKKGLGHYLYSITDGLEPNETVEGAVFYRNSDEPL
jgi:hypothetical protein